MRQISIRTLKAKLSAEMKDLPFAVTNNGNVVGYMVKDCSHTVEKDVVTPTKCSHTLKDKTELFKKHLKEDAKTWVNPLANSALAPKGKV